MNISICDETQKLLEEEMSRGGFASADHAVRTALHMLKGARAEDLEELDEATQAAIERAFEQSARGQGRPWEQVRAELETKYAAK